MNFFPPGPLERWEGQTGKSLWIKGQSKEVKGAFK